MNVNEREPEAELAARYALVGRHSERIEKLSAEYKWKAENNIRFYEQLGMTTEQKVDFLAKEFAVIHWLVEIDAQSIQHPQFGAISEAKDFLEGR